MALRDLIQELRELGLSGSIFRTGWELKMRSGLMERSRPAPCFEEFEIEPEWRERLPFADPDKVATAVRPRIPKSKLARLAGLAYGAIDGQILCFGRWTAEFGSPIDWYVNPTNGRRW